VSGLALVGLMVVLALFLVALNASSLLIHERPRRDVLGSSRGGSNLAVTWHYLQTVTHGWRERDLLRYLISRNILVISSFLRS